MQRNKLEEDLARLISDIKYEYQKGLQIKYCGLYLLSVTGINKRLRGMKEILCGHFSTFISTLLTQGSALFTMLVFMLAAFCTTCRAHICAYFAKLCSRLTAEAHNLSCSITYCSTLHIQLNALCHHFHVLFLGT